MEPVNPSSMLYFSLLPRHLNKYFRKKYLDNRYDCIWYPLYRIESTSHPRVIADTDLDYYYACMISAVTDGYTNILRYLHKKQPWLLSRSTDSLTHMACNNNHADTLQWIHETYKVEIDDNMIDDVVLFECIDVLKYIHRVKGPFMKDIWTYAAKHGSIRILEWLADEKIIDNRIASEIKIYEGAIMRGRVDVIEWIHNAGFEWEPNMLWYAMEYEEYKVMEWLLASDCPKSEYEIRNALWTIESYNTPST